MNAAAELEHDLNDLLTECHDDPLGYVMAMWPWGQPGTPLEHFPGPRAWQRQFLIDLGQHTAARAFDGLHVVPAVKMAVSSGVGPGKTAMLAWILHWLMDTRPDCKCRVTANTATQLETTTWPEIQKWGALKLTADRWTSNSETMYATGDRNNWFAVRTTCAPENAQAFAGWHNITSATANFYDEAGTIPDEIFEKGRGIEMDGEPFQFLFGQCSRRSGQLHRAVFGSDRDNWDARIVNGYDVNPSPVTLALYKEWEDTYGGPDSDYCRVHILGLPPNSDDLQFIDSARIIAAQRVVPAYLPDEPLVAGVDVPDRGPAWFVVRFRRGKDARTLPPIRIQGTADPAQRGQFVAILAERLRDETPGKKITAMFIDSAFGAAIYERLRSLGFSNVHEVRFGGDSPDPQYENQRAYQWGRMKEALGAGLAIDSRDKRLEADLSAPGYHLNRRDRIVLEAKEAMAKRGVASPDDGDALSLTFARRVAVPKPEARVRPYQPTARYG